MIEWRFVERKKNQETDWAKHDQEQIKKGKCRTFYKIESVSLTSFITIVYNSHGIHCLFSSAAADCRLLLLANNKSQDIKKYLLVYPNPIELARDNISEIFSWGEILLNWSKKYMYFRNGLSESTTNTHHIDMEMDMAIRKRNKKQSIYSLCQLYRRKKKTLPINNHFSDVPWNVHVLCAVRVCSENDDALVPMRLDLLTEYNKNNHHVGLSLLG